MAEADFFLPAVWSLDSANVQAVESSHSDPKVRLDSTGVFITDASGNRQAQLDQNGLKIIVPAQLAKNVRPAAQPSQEIEIVRRGDLQRYARLWGTQYTPGSRSERNVHLTATDELQSAYAEIWLTTTTDPNNAVKSSAVIAATDGGSATILDNTGASDFARQTGFNSSGLVSGPWTGATFFSPFLEVGRYWVGMSLSCFANAPGLVGVSCFQGGVFIGQTVMYFNEPSSHKAMPTTWMPITIPTRATYTFQIANGSNCLSDNGDTASLVILPRQ